MLTFICILCYRTAEKKALNEGSTSETTVRRKKNTNKKTEKKNKTIPVNVQISKKSCNFFHLKNGLKKLIYIYIFHCTKYYISWL